MKSELCYNLLSKALETGKNSSFALNTMALLDLENGIKVHVMELIQRAIDLSTNEIEMANLYYLLISAETQK